MSGIKMYKRRSAEYLIESGLPYTIINPCWLVDEAEGKRELVFSKRDELRTPDYTKTYKLTRQDLAEVIVQSLVIEDSRNKAFDLLSREREPVIDFVAAFQNTTSGL